MLTMLLKEKCEINQ